MEFSYDTSWVSSEEARPLSLSLPMNLDGVTGARADLSQTLTVSKWDIRFLNTSSSGFMDGSIAFDIAGPTLFPYGATFEYPRRKTPDVSLVCH